MRWLNLIGAAAAARSAPFLRGGGRRLDQCPELSLIKSQYCEDLPGGAPADLPTCTDPCLCKGNHCQGEGDGEENCFAPDDENNCPDPDGGGLDIYEVESAVDVPGGDDCWPCPAKKDCPALRALDPSECAAVDTETLVQGCDAENLPSTGPDRYQVGDVCASSGGECYTEDGLDNCGSSSLYELVAFRGDCPYLEVIEGSDCPDDLDALPHCHDPCLCEDQLCVDRGDVDAGQCGGGSAADNCDGDKDVYRVTSTYYADRSACAACATRGDEGGGEDGGEEGDEAEEASGDDADWCPDVSPISANNCGNLASPVDELRSCDDPCLCKGNHCLGRNSCAAADLDNCGLFDVYEVDSALGRPGGDACPPCPAFHKHDCPALEPLEADDCDDVDEFTKGCFKDTGAPIGAVCEASADGECFTENKLNNCGKDDLYRVVQNGPGCPYLEAIKSRECPVEPSELPKCHHKCLCAGQFCLGKGAEAEKCGAGEDLDNCEDGSDVYRVTSTYYMDLTGCAECPAPPPPTPRPTPQPTEPPPPDCPLLGAIPSNRCNNLEVPVEDLPGCTDPCLCKGMHCLGEGDSRSKCFASKSLNNCEDGADVYEVLSALNVPGGDTCPPCPAKDGCPALVGLTADECPADDAPYADDCQFGDGGGFVGALCEAGGECFTERALDTCGTKDFYRVVAHGAGCPYLEALAPDACPDPDAVQDLPKCHSEPCLVEGDFCVGGGEEKCGAGKQLQNCAKTGSGEKKSIYRVTSTYYMDPTACVGDDGGGAPGPVDPAPSPEPTDGPMPTRKPLAEGETHEPTLSQRPTYGPTYKPTPKPTVADDSVIVTPGCPIIKPVAGGACPADLDLEKCNNILLRAGDLCEGDGECGTDPKLNNCANDEISGADIYVLVDAPQPTPRPTGNLRAETSVRFRADELEEAFPDWRTNAVIQQAVADSLISSGVVDSVYGVRFVARPDIVARRRLDYASAAAICDVGVFDDGTLTTAARNDIAAYVALQMQYGARGILQPSLKKSIRKHNEQLEKSFDSDATANFAVEDTTAEGPAPPRPTPRPVGPAPKPTPLDPNGTGRPTSRPGAPTSRPTERPTGGGSKKKKSDDDDGPIPGLGYGAGVALIVFLCLAACLICVALGIMFGPSSESPFKKKKPARVPAEPFSTELEMPEGGPRAPYKDKPVESARGADPYAQGHAAGRARVEVNPLVTAPKDDEAKRMEDVVY